MAENHDNTPHSEVVRIPVTKPTESTTRQGLEGICVPVKESNKDISEQGPNVSRTGMGNSRPQADSEVDTLTSEGIIKGEDLWACNDFTPLEAQSFGCYQTPNCAGNDLKKRNSPHPKRLASMYATNHTNDQA